MNLHLAVDLASIGPALELAEAIHHLFRSIWLSPVLLKNEGLRAVEAFRSRLPAMPLVADMRAFESGAIEATLSFGARADMMTALASASDNVVVDVLRTAGRLPIRVAFDLNGCHEPARRAERLAALGVREFVLRPETPEQWDLARSLVLRQSPKLTFYASGCHGAEFLEEASRFEVGDVLVGPSVYTKPDPEQAARSLYDVAQRLSAR